MNIAYVRVSTAEQNEQRQVEAMKSFQIEKWFVEKISGKDMHRPKLQEMLEFVREGDTVHIHDFSRLARSTADLLNIVDTLNRKGATLISNKENIDTSTPTGKLMLTFIGAIAEFERQNLLDRQREGIALAKAAGKYKGGKRKTVRDFEDGYARYKERLTSKAQLARDLHISRPTLDKLIKEFESNHSAQF
ncbi:MAG: recombinase family protein [Faecousia sp.]